MKNHGKGQAAIWTPQIIRKMRSRLVSPQQRLIFEISLFTGERMGAITQHWRAIFNELGLTGFSTHSSRRWVINSLRQAGIEIVTIAEVMSMNISTVRHYLDHDPRECRRAIATLTI